VGGSKEISAIVEDDEKPVIEIGVRGSAVDGSVFRQCWIRNGKQCGKISKTVGGALDADLGDDGIFIIPADEYLSRATGGGGEPGKSVLCQ
jgi:hypothetical protein